MVYINIIIYVEMPVERCFGFFGRGSDGFLWWICNMCNNFTKRPEFYTTDVWDKTLLTRKSVKLAKKKKKGICKKTV